MQELHIAVGQYAEMGFDTLPLDPGAKGTKLRDWQFRSPEEMWENAPKDANLGLRAGGRAELAFIDCDDKERPGTLVNVQNWLDGLGYPNGSYPLVRTASGLGGHIYIQFGKGLPKHTRDISERFGSGEFRYGPGAYVVAPPSVVDSSRYELLQGDLLHRPFLTVKDILPLLKTQNLSTERQMISDATPNRIPRRTLALLNGVGTDDYDSRSQAEQAILTGLVNKGFSFNEVSRLFKRYPCAGKFQEKYDNSQTDALDWLRRSYDNAVLFASGNESKPRQLAKSAMEWANHRPWKGKTGQYDKMVYIAHASIAYQAGRYEYAVSTRTLAEMTGLSPEACSSATERLCEAGMIALVKEWSASLSNTYRLESQSLTLPSPQL